jgi:hypothetical protein
MSPKRTVTQAWWHKPSTILALRRLGQKDHKIEDNLDYITRSYIKRRQQQRW